MYFVYLIVSKNKKRTISYVGYTNNIKKRLKNHNDSKGAKFTSKSNAMKYEYNIKKNRKKRLFILKQVI